MPTRAFIAAAVGVASLLAGCAARGSSGEGGSPATSVTPDGAAIYAARCAACHGRNGGGGAGPALVGPTATTFPNAAAEVAVVARGQGTMPGFGSQLSAEELAAVVAYVRSGLG